MYHNVHAARSTRLWRVLLEEKAACITLWCKSCTLCAQIRLLAHEGDLVCGMDFHVDVREGWDRHWRNIPAVDIHPWGPHGPALGVRMLQGT